MRVESGCEISDLRLTRADLGAHVSQRVCTRTSYQTYARTSQPTGAYECMYLVLNLCSYIVTGAYECIPVGTTCYCTQQSCLPEPRSERNNKKKERLQPQHCCSPLYAHKVEVEKENNTNEITLLPSDKTGLEGCASQSDSTLDFIARANQYEAPAISGGSSHQPD